MSELRTGEELVRVVLAVRWGEEVAGEVRVGVLAVGEPAGSWVGTGSEQKESMCDEGEGAAIGRESCGSEAEGGLG